MDKVYHLVNKVIEFFSSICYYIFTSIGPFSVIKVACRGSDVGLRNCIGESGVVGSFSPTFKSCLFKLERNVPAHAWDSEILGMLYLFVDLTCHLGTNVILESLDWSMSGTVDCFGLIWRNLFLNKYLIRSNHSSKGYDKIMSFTWAIFRAQFIYRLVFFISVSIFTLLWADEEIDNSSEYSFFSLSNSLILSSVLDG